MWSKVLLLCLVAFSATSAQVFTELPRHLQFFPRDTEDSAIVPISGMTFTPGYDSFFVEVLRNGVVRKRYSKPAVYDGQTAAFSFQPKIYAELAEYSVRVHAKAPVAIDTLVRVDSLVAGDVYLIAGQSNAVLSRGDVTWKNQYCRTFGNYNSQLPGDTNWALSAADTNLRNPAVGVWALNLQKKLADTYGIPTCIINGAVGGKTIESMLRNDGNPTRLTTIYGMMLNRVRKAGLTEHAKALFWYQGESNTGSNYLNNFSTMHEDWKTDYPNLQKIYVFQIRPGCNINREHAWLREVQRTLPNYFSNVTTISTTGIPYHDGCHFTTKGYEIVAERVFRVLSRDFYGSVDTASLEAPNIRKAYYTNGARTEIALVFSPPGSTLSATPDVMNDSIQAELEDYFYIDDKHGNVDTVLLNGDTLLLQLKAPTFGELITYLPDKYYNSTLRFYEGPWIVNEAGIGAYSFWHIQIQPPLSVATAFVSEEQFAVYPNPATSFASFVVTLPEDDDITIELFDPLGRKITTVIEERLAAGTYKIPFGIEPTFARTMTARLHSSAGMKTLQFLTIR